MTRSLTGLAVLAGLAIVLAAARLVAQQQDPGPAEPAYLTVKVPADAKVQIGDKLTQATGEVRRFVSPPLSLKTGRKYTYTVKVTYKGPDGREVAAEPKTVEVTPGKTTEVDLTKPAAAARADDKAKTDDKARPAADDKAKGAGDDKPKREPDVIFVPTPPEVVDEMIKLANIKKDDLVYDLGCGDGIIIVTASKKTGCKSIGYDIDPKRVKEARERAKKEGVEDKCTIEEKDIFQVDVSNGNVVALYLLESLNEKLVPQLSKMKAGSRVVTHDFPIPGYKEEQKKTVKIPGKDRDHTVYLYTIPLKKEK